MIQASGPGGWGIRGEADLVGWRHWQFGVALSSGVSRVELMWQGGRGYVDAGDTRAMFYLARTIARGRWSVRAAIGAGLIFTHTSELTWNVINAPMVGSSDGVAAAFDGSLMITRQIGPKWAVTGGPIVNVSDQTLVGDTGPNIHRSDTSLMVLGGIRYAL